MKCAICDAPIRPIIEDDGELEWIHLESNYFSCFPKTAKFGSPFMACAVSPWR